jgi:Protein of unknown function (DUF3987)
MGTIQGADKGDRPVRKQVRHHAWVFLDEGSALFKLTAQIANTTLETLRTAFSGDHLGNLNATEERRRSVDDYHLGIFLGFQPSTVRPLLKDVLAGTPQRLEVAWGIWTGG